MGEEKGSVKMKKLLLVIDYQNDFVSGSLGFEEARALENAICAKIEAYQAAGDDVMCTLDTHSEDYLQTQEGKKLPVPHCLKDSEGWKIYGKAAALLEKCQKFEKPVFGSGALFDYLRSARYESIELCGVVSNICVLSNAVIARTAQPETEIIVDAACVASNDPELNSATLAVLGSLQVTILHNNA